MSDATARVVGRRRRTRIRESFARTLAATALLFAPGFAVSGCRAEEPGGPVPAASDRPPPAVIAEELVAPESFEYVGAFRLPDDGERPRAFAWGGGAMTFNPTGDAGGPDDGFPGSLLVMGHDRIPHGELPDGNQVAEVSIPSPVIADSPADLEQADLLNGFSDVSAGLFDPLQELPRVGMEYLDTPESGPRIHIAWGQHFHEEPDVQIASHASLPADLSTDGVEGPWFIGEQSLYSVNDYLFEIPAEWADRYAGGRYLATGRFRDGGWSGMGPALYAYRPWGPDDEPAEAQSHLEETELLAYARSTETDGIERCLDGYQHPDEWAGGAWLTTADGSSAVMFAGTKSVGERYWYGFVHPDGPEYPCVERESIGEFTACRLADGAPCPDVEELACDDPASYRGWWSSGFEAQFILYDPADLARVATGEIEPWEPQPYARVDIDDRLFLPDDGFEVETLGTGVQRRYRLGDVAFDRADGLVYVLELFAEEARPVVHVWRVR